MFHSSTATEKKSGDPQWKAECFMPVPTALLLPRIFIEHSTEHLLGTFHRTAVLHIFQLVCVRARVGGCCFKSIKHLVI